MSQSYYLTLQSLFRQGLSIILFLLLARYLSISDFGKYQQIILVIGIFSTIVGLGFPYSFTYFYGKNNKYREKILIYKRFFVTQLFISIFLFIIFFILKNYISDYIKNRYIESCSYFISIIFITNSFIEFYRNYYTSRNKIKKFLIISTIFQIISLVISYFIVIQTQNIISILAIMMLSNSMIFLFLVYDNKEYLFLRGNFFISKEEFKYIVFTAPVVLIDVINVYSDQIMVSLMSTPNEYASLRVGAFQIPIIGIGTSALITVMMPVIAKNYAQGKYSEIIKIWKLNIEKAAILLTPIIIFCIFFAKDIITVLFGSKYITSVSIFQVYMVQWLKSVFMIGCLMWTIGLERKMFKVTGIIVIFNIILNYYFIQIFGVIGAALATILSSYISFFIMIKMVNSRLKSKVSSYFPIFRYIIIVVISIFMSISIYYMTESLTKNILTLSIISLIFYLITISLIVKILYGKVTLERLKGLL